jgi:hypothetical protein
VRTAASVRYFRQFADWARANGVRVFMSWPNACRPDVPLPPGGDEPPDAMKALLKALNFIVLDRPPETAFPRQWFTDTSYHCDAPTRRVRTEALAKRLRKYFDLPPLPDRPTGFYLVASQAHRPRPGNAFADDPGVEVKYLAADPIDHPDAATPGQATKWLEAGLPLYFDEPEAGGMLTPVGRPMEVARKTASLPRWWRQYGRHIFLIARGPGAGAGAGDGTKYLPAALDRALAAPAPFVAAVGTGPYARVETVITSARGAGRGPSMNTELRLLSGGDTPQLWLVVSAPPAGGAGRCEIRVNREVRDAPGAGAGGAGGVSVAVIDPEQGIVVDAATFPDAAGGETVTWRMNRIDPPR